MDNFKDFVLEKFNGLNEIIKTIMAKIDLINDKLDRKWNKDIRERNERYLLYLKSDYGRLSSAKVDTVNNNISSNLCEIDAFIDVMLDKPDEDLLYWFELTVSKYCNVYYNQNGHYPACNNGWFKTISEAKKRWNINEST